MKDELDAALGILTGFAVIIGAFGIVCAVTWCAYSALHRGDEK